MKSVIIALALVAIFESCQGDSYSYGDRSLLASSDNAAMFYPRDELLIRKRRVPIERMKNAYEADETILSVSTTHKPEIGLENVAHPTNNKNQHNITKSINDASQEYYKISSSADEAEAKRFWVDMANHLNASVNKVLSHNHRRAVTIKLSFDFPFYGQSIRNVTIATGGFLYTGEFVHRWLATTQYIAPLMANFDTRLSNNSRVTYADNGTAFTVEWKEVALQEQPNAGRFTFQVTLFKNGDIIFVYAAVPLPLEQILDNLHPVEVGLSDAYAMDRTFIKRKTIYEYNRVNLMSKDIKNWTVIKLRALPTCLGMSSCTDCLHKPIGFDCKWCPSINRCSTGTDRHTQNWIWNNCPSTSITQSGNCPAFIANARNYDEHEHDNQNVRAEEGTIRKDNYTLQKGHRILK